MGAAKRGGGLEALYPGGDILRAGWDLVTAVSTALEVLGFLELPEEDVPPEEYWHSQDHLTDWFESVKRRRQDEARGIKSIEPGEDLDDPDPYVDPEVSALRG